MLHVPSERVLDTGYPVMGSFDDNPGSSPAWTLGGDPVQGAPTPLQDAASARYDLRSVLGQGGMGRVRVAWDRVLRREVALKEVLPSSHPQAARLQREAWITARLDHPGIIAVHDAGALPDGRPFYTMRLVRGETLAQRLATTATANGRKALLRAVLSVCEAVASAHAAGIVHRDLKPENVLLGRFGEVQVVDWGLATPDPGAAGRWADEEPPPIEAGAVGTPRWMSPEQAAGAEATVRSDVWSLGAILHATATGQAPYDAVSDEGDAAAQLAARRAGPPELQHGEVPAELAAIIHRALAHDAHQRYPDAGALAADLARWLDGGRVEAHTYSSWELLRRALWPWRLPLVGLAAALLVGALGLAVFVVQIRSERDRAIEAKAETSRAHRDAEVRLAEALVAQARAAVHDGDRDEAEAAAIRALQLADSARARGVMAAFGRAGRVQVRRRDPAPDCTWVMLSPTADHFVCGTTSAFSLWQLDAAEPEWQRTQAVRPGGFVDPARFWVQQDGRPAVHRLDGVGPPETHNESRGRSPLQNWSQKLAYLQDGVFPYDLTQDLPCSPLNLAVAPDASQVAWSCTDGSVHVGTVSDPTARHYATPFTERHEISALTWAPTTNELILGSIRGGYGVLDLDTGDLSRMTLPDDGPVIQRLVVSPDGRLVAIERQHGGVGVWGLRSGAWLTTVPAPSFASVGFVDADTLAIVDDEIREVDVSEVGPPNKLWFTSGIADVAVAPDGEHVFVGLGNGRVESFDVRTGARQQRAQLSSEVVKAVVPTAAGGLYLAHMGSAPVLHIPPGRTEPEPLPGWSPLRRLVRLADGSLHGVSFTSDRWRRMPGDGTPTATGTEAPYRDLEASASGRAAIGLEGDTRVMRLSSPSAQWQAYEVPHRARAVAIRDDGTSAVAWADRVLIYPPDLQDPVRLSAPNAGLRDLAFSHDGRRIGGTGLDGQVWLWRVSDGKLLAEMTGHTDRVYTLAFAPDDRWLVTGGWDHTVRVWDLTALSE